MLFMPIRITLTHSQQDVKMISEYLLVERTFYNGRAIHIKLVDTSDARYGGIAPAQVKELSVDRDHVIHLIEEGNTVTNKVVKNNGLVGRGTEIFVREIKGRKYLKTTDDGLERDTV
jgi:hypothetical protein